MSIILRRRLFETAAVFAMALACAGGAAAQDQPSEFESWRLPGWSFTPGITFGGLYDSNVALAAPDVNKKTAGDKLLTIEPFGQLEFFNPRTSFSGGYHGLLRRYVTLSGLDDSDQRAYASYRERLTRRVSVFLTDNFARVATTDMLQLNGVPFRRTGGRYNDFVGGVEARLSRTNDLAVRAESTWVDFVRKQDVDLTGGIVNGVDTELSHRFTERVSLGGEYDVRLANLNGELRSLLFQEVGGTFHYRVTDVTTFDAAAGMAHLLDRDRALTRTGPYIKVNVMHRMERATVGATYRRSYVPSLAFGGTNQSQEVTGYLMMPFRKNRFYVQESAAWRRTDPFITTELPLSSIWVHNLVGYVIARWFRIEGFYQFTGQDNRLVEGKVTRSLFGVQFVVAQPVRIR
jgi:hypothetical protein